MTIRRLRPRVRAADGISRRDARGASAVEYGLLISGVAAVIAAAVFLFGGNVSDLFQGTCDEVAAQQASGSC